MHVLQVHRCHLYAGARKHVLCDPPWQCTSAYGHRGPVVSRIDYRMTSHSENRRRISCLAPLVLGLAAWTALPVAAAPGEPPEHARVSRYGSGWDCNTGFRRVGDTCVQVVVPAHAYLDAAGSGWRCNRGYRNVNERCVVIQVPQNAYLD